MISMDSHIRICDAQSGDMMQPSGKTYSVYTLLCKEDGKVFYVGCTLTKQGSSPHGSWDGLQRRLYDHLAKARYGGTQPVYRKIRELQQKGLTVSIELCGVHPTYLAGKNAEFNLITLYGLDNLTNVQGKCPPFHYLGKSKEIVCFNGKRITIPRGTAELFQN